MNHLDLFSGIGGFSLAAQRVWGEEHNIVAFVEQDKYCQQILNKHWLDVPIFDDIKEFNGKQYADTVDLLTAGVPCQPASVAGKQKGTEDDRWLWPEAHRIVREAHPEWIIFENPNGILTLNDGLEFDKVLSDLESEGYETQPFIIPACGVDARHRRERVWIVANSRFGKQGKRGNANQMLDERNRQKRSTSSISGSSPDVSNPDKAGQRERWRAQPVQEEFNSTECDGQIITNTNKQHGNDGGFGTSKISQFATSGIFKGKQWPVEPDVGRVAHGVPNRIHRLKALGNAIVPQVVVPIMQAIKDIEDKKD